MDRIRRALFSGGRVFTANPEQPWAEAVVVEDGQIVFVGDAEEAHQLAGSEADRIDAGGGLIMPGFIDSHVHIAMTGASLLKAQLRDAPDLATIQERVRIWAEANPDAPRVLGVSWLYSSLDGPPTRQMLDEVVPDRPVYLDSNDLHSSWLNSAALDEVGITSDTPDPHGGRIVRDANTGEATGHLLESANVDYVWSLLAQVSDDELDAQIAAAVEAYSAAGITSVVEMALTEPQLEALARASEVGTLPVRVVAHLIVFRADDPTAELAQVERAAELSAQYTGDQLRVAGIKIVTDGTIDGCTAAMIDPYSNGTNEAPIWDATALAPVVEAADAAGIQIAIHAIGDYAIRIALDSFEAAIRANGPRARRHRIEHLEYANERDIARLGELGITASMQPVHLDPTIMSNWVELLGPERAEAGFAWPLYLEGGAPLVFGTDTPTAPYEPIPNMYLASTRRSPSDPSLAPHRPDWAFSLEKALCHATRECAHAAWLDHITGTLKAGHAADLVVLDRDVLTDGPASLLQAKVKLTMTTGEVVFPSASTSR